MLDFFMTILSGGATGLLGSLISSGFKFFQGIQDRKEAAEIRAHELALQRLAIETGQAETESELKIITEESRRDQLVASYRHDSEIGRSSRWVVNILRLVRPVLTFALIALTAWIYFKLTDALAGGNAAVLREYIVHTIVYTTSAAVLWWFGDRALSPRKTA